MTGALGALFTLLGTVAGAYFGAKSSRDTADRAKKQVDEANARMERANRSAKVSTERMRCCCAGLDLLDSI